MSPLTGPPGPSSTRERSERNLSHLRADLVEITQMTAKMRLRNYLTLLRSGERFRSSPGGRATKVSIYLLGRGAVVEPLPVLKLDCVITYIMTGITNKFQ